MRTLGHRSWGANVVTRRLFVVAAIAALTGCTLDKQTAPPLAGPSELALSIAMSVTPDILTQDGQSQATLTITARDAYSQPVRGLTLRVDMVQSGGAVQFGTLSSTTVSTNSDGRATLSYTAPPPPPSTAGDSVLMDFEATPVGSDYANTQHTFTTIKLVRPGAPLGPPPTQFAASFIFSPGSPHEGDTVQFDGSASTDDSGAITSYAWNFGDGGTASGVRVTHTYDLTGQYSATLTITDNRGFSTTSAPQTISVGTTATPVPVFVSSPTTPIAGTPAFFNASASKAANGHSIVSYDWDFGDGTTASGVTVSHTFALPGGYAVTLVVTDDTGRTGSITQTVTAATSNPTASFTSAPSPVHTTDIISLDATASSAVLGRVIVTYQWDFSGAFVGTASGSTVNIGPIGGAGGTLTVKLTVTDSGGQIGILTRTITILP